MTIDLLPDIYSLFTSGIIIGGLLSFFPFIVGWFVNFIISLIRSA